MKIVVLAGGISTERDVSLVSGMGIYRALKSKNHQVMLLDVFLGYNGEDWRDVFEKDVDWAGSIDAIKEQNPDIEEVKALRPDWKKNFFGPHVIEICQNADIVFMALHGENGENGKIQACFDLNGIRYTGTDYVSSAICMNKAIAKDLFISAGVPTPAGIRLRKGGDTAKQVPYPCVVKACCGGSSVGVFMVHNDDEYEHALEEAFQYDDEIVVEQYIKGREFSVGVVDGKAYPVIEIAPLHGFYDYKNKYQAGSTVETCPAQLSEEKTKAMQKAAELAFKVLRLKHYARMDFMMDENENFYCLEANTLPGMTPMSLLPQEAKVLGLDYADLCQLLIDLSMRD
ncbi:MAG: D-alanine--D-alanine ligase [Coprococcus sp.]